MGFVAGVLLLENSICQVYLEVERILRTPEVL